jgi:hypothetical protein
MDAVLGDHRVNRRLLRLATLTYALDNFPRLIYRLKQGRLFISPSTVLDGKKAFRCRNRQHRHESWIILETDFNLCRDIANRMELKIFPSDTQKVIEERIRSMVRVSFNDRPF